MIRDVADLKVYTNALENLRLLYELTRQISDSHRKLRNQTNESAESIAPLIAEGYGKKRSEKEFKRFLEMALGSSDEVITHIRQIKILSERIRTINQDLCDQLIERYKIESKQLQQLIKNWQTYHL